MERPLRKLSVAVATGRVAAVFLEGDKVVATRMSRTAANDTKNAARIVQSWIDGYEPDHMIAEDPKTALRKGENTKAILETITTIYENGDGLDVCVPRRQSYQNKYIEAKALAKRYPEVAHFLPRARPPIWMPEPRHMSYFEALALVDELRN